MEFDGDVGWGPARWRGFLILASMDLDLFEMVKTWEKRMGAWNGHGVERDIF